MKRKVIIPKEVASAVEGFRKDGRKDSEIIIRAVTIRRLASDWEWVIHDWVKVVGDAALMQALIDGFEVGGTCEQYCEGEETQMLTYSDIYKRWMCEGCYDRTASLFFGVNEDYEEDAE